MTWLVLCMVLGPTAPSAAKTAQGLYESGQYSKAYTLSERLLADPNATQNDTETARLIQAFASLRLGRTADRAEKFAALKQSGLDLGPYFALLQVQAFVHAGDCAQSLREGRAIPEASVFASRAWALVTDCALRARDKETMAQALEAMGQSAQDDNEQAAYALMKARYAMMLGDTLQARDRLRDLITGHPLTPSARAARTWLSQLKHRGVPVSPLDPEELFPRAESERRRLHSDVARRAYRDVMAQSQRAHRADLSAMAQLGLVQIDMAEQHYSRAKKRLEPVLRSTDDNELKALALFLKGDLLNRLGDDDGAMAIWKQAVDALPNEPYTRIAALKGAQRAFDRGDFASARALCLWLLGLPPRNISFAYVRDDGAMDDTQSDADARDRALWLLAWMGHKDQAPAASVDTYLAQIHGHGSEGDAAMYWRARFALDANDTENALNFSELLLAQAPTSIYSLLIYDRLTTAIPTCDVRLALPAAPSDQAPPTVAQASDLKAALVLYSHGMIGEARNFLRLLPIQSLSDADRAVAGYMYGQCGDVRRAAELVRRPLEKRPPKGGVTDLALVPLSYPRPYETQVKRAAKDYNVPAELIYAIMREESAFNPRAVSPREARGLMQLIPPTAKRIALAARVRHFSPNRLLDPTVGVRLGAYYLKVLLAKMDGNLVATVAAYQAGERNVSRWRTRAQSLSDDEFIEEIPLESTRAYAKNVLAALGVYRLLAGYTVHEAANLHWDKDAPLLPRQATEK